MKTKSLLICFFPLVLVSCMKVKNKGAMEPPPEAKAQKISNTQELPYEILGGENPDSYSYKFFLGLPRAQLFVNRTSGESSAIENIQTDTNGDWLEEKIPAGPETNYQFGYFQNNEFKAFKTISISRPKDLVISGTMKWSQIKDNFVSDSLNRLRLEKFHRLYFKEGSVLVTEGQNLNLSVKEFYSKNSELQTWPEGQKAAAGQIGRNGGQIFISAEKAYGKITIKLRGENGGDGIAGKGDPTLNGAPGMAGLPHKFTSQTDRSSCLGEICITHHTCLNAATSGGQGGPGRKGFKGGTGFRGGNSGFIQFKISSASDLVWNPDVIPGLGGEGGSGGPGGEGGPGGPSGEWQLQSYYNPNVKLAGPCPKPLDSLKGPPGEFGDKGDLGTPGVKEISCIAEGATTHVCL